MVEHNTFNLCLDRLRPRPLCSVSESNGSSVSYGYDERNLLRRLTDSVGGQALEVYATC